MMVFLFRFNTSALSNQVVDFFSDIFYTKNWPARWHCGKWTDFHGWFYILSELTIWAAYFAIPILLFRILIKRTDIPFPKIFLLFIAFILLCGSTHLMDAVIFWWPAYRLSAVLRFITALVSIFTVYALYKILPVVFTLKTAQQLEDEIEQRKIAEKKAQAQLTEVQRILEASLDIICTINNDGTFVSVSRAAETILGYPVDELIGKQYIDLIHPDDIEKTQACAAELFTGVAVTDFSNRYLRIDGSWVHISWKCNISDDKSIAFCIARDVTEIKYQEEVKERLNDALLEKIEKLTEQDKTLEKIREFKFLADSIPQIIWTAKPDGNVDYYNQHWYDYTGMTLEETQGWGWAPVLHPHDLQTCIDVWTESYTTGKPYEIEYRFKRAADGVYKWHLGRAIPMRNEKGEIIKWFGSCTDIDEYKHALDLENKITQYEDFNRIVAHNLRGPAGSIDMMLHMLSETKIEEDKANLLGMLMASSKTLNDTLNDLMKVLEIRFNKQMDFDDCNLQELIATVTNMLTGQIISKNAVLTTDLKLPVINFPKIYLESIVYNMLSNALKYSKSDVPPVIQISSYNENGRAVLRFEDNGLGIDLNRHGKNIFKLNKVFHKGFDSKGVGLFMTKTQIETFGGKIAINSEPNIGTEFIITL